MPKTRRLGDEAVRKAFGARHTAAQAVGEMHGAAQERPLRPQAWPKITNIRLSAEQWLWLRQKALSYAMETGKRADASEVMRSLIDQAMERERR